MRKNIKIQGNPLLPFLDQISPTTQNAPLCLSPDRGCRRMQFWLILSNDLITEHVIYSNFNLKFYLAIAESISFFKK